MLPLVGLFISPLLSQSYIVKGPDDLKKFATALLTSPDVGTSTIEIDYYQNPGQFKIDRPHANVQVLQFKRANSDSEAVIKVDSTFIDIRNMTTGTLALRGLAFRLGNPKAVLIAGADNLKPNHNLLLDSCFVFGDSLEGTFLSWLGGAGSRIEITNSWFVFRGGRIDLAKMLLNGETISFSNNLINYPGSIESQAVTKAFDFRSNTLNRTQLVLNGKLSGGKFPNFFFNRNLFAHRHEHSVFGGDLYYVASIGSFDVPSSSMSSNRMYSSWKGFDVQNPSKFGDDRTNTIDDIRDGRGVTELWNWYTEVRDPLTGMLSGSGNRARYNVMPDETSYLFTLDKTDLTAFFRPAPYPRTIALGFQAGPVNPDPPFRIRYPFNGWMHFGPFQIDRLTLKAKSEYGKPVLLAQDADKLFKLQPGTARLGETPSVYANGIPSARNFVLADSGNTPRGTNITPSGVSLLPTERLVFAKVDSAGITTIGDAPAPAWPRDVRPLNKNFTFVTNSLINSQVTFGAPPGTGTAPYHPGKDSIFWFQPPATLIPVTRDSVRYLATKAFDSRVTSTFSAFLVEKLSMPRGDTSLPLPEGALRSASAAGYQIYVDSNGVYDTAQYAQGTKGYRLNWIGRASADLLFLELKGPPLSQAFVKTTTGVDSLPLVARDSNGVFKIRIQMSDTGKTFFTAVKYNVTAMVAFNGTLAGEQVYGFTSATSGKLAFQQESAPFAPGPSDTAVAADFRNTRFLGGRRNAGFNLAPVGLFNLEFEITQPQDTQNVEAWYLDGQTWKRLAMDSSGVLGKRVILKGVPAKATRIVVVERFQAPEIYVTPKPDIRNGQFVLYLKHDISPNPLLGFCVETRTINPSGEITTEHCVEKNPTDTIFVALVPNQALSWKISYFMGSPSDKVQLQRSFQVLTKAVWNSKSQLTDTLAKIPAGQWRLVGMPVTSTLAKVLKKSGERVKATVRETTLVCLLRDSSGFAVLDPVKDLAKEPVRPGKGFLVADSRQTHLTLDSLADTTRAAQPEAVSLKKGWNLVANPYPISLRTNRIRTKPERNLKFMRLNRSGMPGEGVYTWDSVTAAIRPFEGVAVYAAAPESLYFDPADSTLPAVSSTKARIKSVSSGRRVVVGLRNAFGVSRMALTTEAGEIPIGFLPAPATGLEMRVGGKAGYWIKPISDFRAVDEPIVIRSDRATTAAFTFGDEGQAAGLEFALIDESSGAVYTRADAAELPISAGTHAYRLVAGDAAYVGERTRAFLADAPAQMALSQNFPNPFRGRTRIALDWPAIRAADRKATLEVSDMQGRRVALLPIDGIKVGRQVLTLDASAWKPGIYVYRLTVTAGGRVSRLQKRMLVSP